jgi:cell wall-associated NlpC family hydrolase
MINGVLPDPRRHAYRADLAAASLRDRVEAPRYVAGEPRQVGVAALPLRRGPRFDANLDSEALFGETVTLYEEAEGWAWVQLNRDAYVGYMPSEGLRRDILTPTHKVTSLRTYVYPKPDSKSPPLALLSLNAHLSALGEEGTFLALASGGYIFAGHAAAVKARAADYVAIAESFLGTPYLWGGRTSLGLDCSGLVQLAVEAAGLRCPRDADMQGAELGRPIDWQGVDKLTRGDLVFWEGHVGIMTGPDHLLHANAHHMAVAVEPLAQARARIAAFSNEVLSVRRLLRMDASRPGSPSEERRTATKE